MPVTASATVWSCANVTPLAIATVSVALSPSSIAAGAADTVNSAASSSSTVTVAADAGPTL